MRLLLTLGAVLALFSAPVDAGMLLAGAPAVCGSTPCGGNAPTLTGGTAVGNVLTCGTNGGWSGPPTITYTYQFFRDGSSIAAPASTTAYTIVSADQGHSITCKEIATNGSGSTNSPASNAVSIPGGAAPTGTCSQSTAFFAQVWALPATLDGTVGGTAGPTNHLAAYDNLICGLVTDTTWGQLDALWVLATNVVTGTATAVANLNLVSSSFTLTPSATAPAFAANAGYTGVDGSTAVYLNTGFNPSAQSGTSKYTLNSAHVMTWVLNTHQPTVAYTTIGAKDGTNKLQIAPWDNAGQTPADVNYGGSNNALINVSDSKGMWLANRTGASASQIWWNGSTPALASGPFASVGLPNVAIALLATNNLTGGVNNGISDQVAAASVGASLSGPQASGGTPPTTGLYGRLCTYLTAVGARSGTC